jgi:hypothetical protein
MRTGQQALILALFGAAIATPQIAHGQTTELAPPDDSFLRDRNITVTERIQPGYEQVPVPLGGFDLFPSFTGGPVYDDNVFAQPANTKSDVYGILRTDLNLQSNWSRNFLQTTGFVEYDGYARLTDESSLQRGATIDGRLDISHGFYLTGSATYQNLIEPRSDSGAPTFTKHPVDYDEIIFNGQLSKTWDRLRLQVNAKSDAYAYDTAETPTGTPVPLQFRNDDIYTITGRLEYAVTPDTSVFVEVIGNNHAYNSRLGDPSTFDRNSHGYEFSGGLSTDLTSLLRGEFSLGYLSQSFKDPRLPTEGGLGARGQLVFFPSGLTNITLDGSRTYEDSPLAQAPLYLASNVGLRVDHELLRNVLLFARVSYEEDAYINLARTDKRPQFELGGGYQMNRWLAWKLDYRHLKSTPVGADAGLGFKDDRVALTLTARL